jgi:hypothetical protein
MKLMRWDEVLVQHNYSRIVAKFERDVNFLVIGDVVRYDTWAKKSYQAYTGPRKSGSSAWSSEDLPVDVGSASLYSDTYNRVECRSLAPEGIEREHGLHDFRNC